MPTRDLYDPSNLPRLFNAILFSLNAAFVSMSLFFLAAPRLYSDLVAGVGSKLLAVPRNHFASEPLIYWMLAMVAAAILAVLQALLWRTKALRVLHHSVAGFVALCSPVVFWVFINTKGGWQFGVRFWAAAFEFPVALAFAFLFQSRRIHFGSWFGILLLAAHFLLWFWVFGNASAANYAGPIGPALGFLAAVAWGAYIEADAFSQFLRGTDLPICI